MEQILLNYWNKTLHIGMVDWRTVYLVENESIKLIPEVYKGNLVYRIPGSFKRYSRSQIENGLVKRKMRLKVEAPSNNP